MNCTVLRFDISHSLITYITDYLYSPVPLGKTRIVNGQRFVSHGFPGRSGDLVVDDADKPFLMYGKIDVQGNFERNFSLYNSNSKYFHA